MAEMVHPKGRLEAILSIGHSLPRGEPRIADDGMQWWEIAGSQFLCKRADRGERGQIEMEGIDSAIACLAFQLLHGGSRFGAIAAGNHHVPVLAGGSDRLCTAVAQTTVAASNH